MVGPATLAGRGRRRSRFSAASHWKCGHHPPPQPCRALRARRQSRLRRQVERPTAWAGDLPFGPRGITGPLDCLPERMERSLPGITATARGLFTSLVFGLRRLVTADSIPRGFRYTNEGVQGFARWLVHRMANYRAHPLLCGRSMLGEGQGRILNKLSGLA